VIKRTIHITYRVARRIVITLLGATVVLLGIVMLVTPGPAFIVIPTGLAILALEYTWAHRWLQQVRSGAEYTWQRWGWKRRNGNRDR